MLTLGILGLLCAGTFAVIVAAIAVAASRERHP
jgi:hypothetical protein